MNNKLTNKEIEKIFHLYHGAEYRYSNEFGTYKGKVEFGHHINLHLEQEAKLCLIPLSSINEEDAIEVARFAYTDIVPREELIQIGKDYIGYYYHGNELHDSRYGKLKELSCDPLIVMSIHEYLRLKKYTLPVWLGIDHWANHKTPIELGIAVDKTKINSHD